MAEYPIRLILSGDIDEDRGDAIYELDPTLLESNSSPENKRTLAYLKILTNQVNTLTKIVYELREQNINLSNRIKNVK